MGNYINERVAAKLALGKNSVAEQYRAAGNHFLLFIGNPGIPMDRVTAEMVSDFIAYLQSKHLKANTINSYLSSLRAIYNCALESGRLTTMRHPFMRMRLRREMTAKRGLPLRDIKRIAATRYRTPALERSADLALFSFLACGMPFIDLVHLTYAENVSGNELAYRRRKTGVEIRMQITDGMRQLLEKHKKAGSPYLFPLSQNGLSHKQYKRLLKEHNLALKTIGEELNLPLPLTSYVMRHTWASEAKRQYVPLPVISQALGHTSERATLFYINKLDQREQDKANSKITWTIGKIIKERRTYL